MAQVMTKELAGEYKQWKKTNHQWVDHMVGKEACAARFHPIILMVITPGSLIAIIAFHKTLLISLGLEEV